jgi:membrane protein
MAGRAPTGRLGWLRSRASAARRRYGWLDLAVRAANRYREVNAYRLAAAMTYHAFLTVFPAAALVFAAFGFLLDSNDELAATVRTTLTLNLPGLPVEEISESRSTAGLLGLVGVLIAGLGWVDTVRTSVRAVWHKREMPGSLLRAKLLDLAVLGGLGAVLAVSLGLVFLFSAGAEWVFDTVGVADDFSRTLLKVLAAVLGIGLNMVFFVALLAGLPRLIIPLRRVVLPALVAAVAMELVKLIGRLYLERTEVNPVYQTVVVAVGLLFFLNLLNQLTLYCAALTAEAGSGEVRDRVRRPPRR